MEQFSFPDLALLCMSKIHVTDMILEIRCKTNQKVKSVIVFERCICKRSSCV